jgi:serine/threonine-protein kinase
MRIYPRDLTPYLADWVNATMKGEKAVIEPETYRSKNKLIAAITFVSTAAVTAAACLLLSNF